ncbi:MAG: hypothetical protein KC496_19785, partial [Anaerolineae bacterium]|nr:hypothetical protein [Anaerolineae bacterium]
LLEQDEDSGMSRIALPDVDNDRLLIQLGTTAPRVMGWIVSIATVLTLGVYTAFRWRTVPGSQEVSILLRKDLAQRILFVVVLALVLRIFPNLNPLRGLLAPQAAHAIESYLQYPNIYDGSINLSRYCYHPNWQEQLITLLPISSDIESCRPRPSYVPGEQIETELIWTQIEPNASPIMVQLRLLSGVSGEVWVEDALRHPGRLPTNRWLPQHYVADRYRFQLPTEIPPGAYTLAFELYNCEPSAPGLYPVCEPMDVQLTLPEPIVLD